MLFFGVHATVEPLSILQTNSDIESDTNDQPYKNDRTPMFRIVKCVAIPLNREVPVPFTTSSAGLSYMAQQPNLMPIRMGLPSSGIVNALSHVSIQTRLTNFATKQTTLRKEC